jgi:hypothetical protein
MNRRFTGLQDVNGKDIYEGDIVEIGDGWPQNTTKEVVGFEKGSFTNCIPPRDEGGCSYYVKIIGKSEGK